MKRWIERALNIHPGDSGAWPAPDFVSIPDHEQLRDWQGGARCVVPGAFPGCVSPVCRYRQRRSRGFRGGWLPAFGAPEFSAQCPHRQSTLLRGKLRSVLGAGEFLSSVLVLSGLLHLGEHFWSAGPDASLDAREPSADHAGGKKRIRNGGGRRDPGRNFCRVCLGVGGSSVWHGESCVVDGPVFGDCLRISVRRMEHSQIPACAVEGAPVGKGGESDRRIFREACG